MLASVAPRGAAPTPASGSRASGRSTALIARAVGLHPAGFGVLDPAMLAAADPEIAVRAAVASRLVSRRVALSGQDGAAGPAADGR